MQKKWYQSKTILFVLVLTALAVYEAVSGDSSATLDILKTLGFGGTVVSLRDALQ